MLLSPHADTSLVMMALMDSSSVLPGPRPTTRIFHLPASFRLSCQTVLFHFTWLCCVLALTSCVLCFQIPPEDSALVVRRHAFVPELRYRRSKSPTTLPRRELLATSSHERSAGNSPRLAFSWRRRVRNNDKGDCANALPAQKRRDLSTVAQLSTTTV